ncbi:hypothetical protein COT48_00500 [Candidatus Woesearchaeota archaeon CG08_land_8_20_14_0_20_47_9]|nr:MAG: hypothetical protein AUJ69_04130 [Candidatus Woesearchaeota archaeon CG1_02_47_18]PIN75777.1 MAG: hypothetical protein COV22_00710 [Candidatus Woesearchaeota archaeon CG10_big_fil_rev_8_21_14_0_10_47_5]PIO04421.1 MAG: hypothetical protein COT48_00500 [Candidatus Woesearchaeota archaeon CG08_land_8_20_14_0_20_47_9]HII29447.1 DNA replication complex GINS family protein [Candidatus Woesearchaeota archaeon]
MTEADVNITYETIFEVLMREKGREELQKLEPDFFKSVVVYLKEKRAVIELNSKSADLFAIEEREKTQKQLHNIYSMIRELYTRREKKIVRLALMRARSGSDLVDMSALLDEEKAIFNELVRLFSDYYKGIVGNILKNRLPNVDRRFLNIRDVKRLEDIGGAGSQTRTLRFLHSVPMFVDSRMQVYGPFEEEDIANLPEEVSNVLVDKGRAEEINIGNDHAEDNKPSASAEKA